MKAKTFREKILIGFGLGASALLAYSVAMAQTLPAEDPPPTLATLKGVPVPLPANLGDYIKDKAAAIRLGKALFWDMAVGSDGKTACASCHFHAGADSRVINQTSPGLKDETPGHAPAFDPTRTRPSSGPNYWLVQEDFPFHVLSDPNDRNSNILFTTDDVVSSQGVFATDLVQPVVITAGAATDKCNNILDPNFQYGGHHTRRVEPRNSPTTINAVFNFRNFWDGRANNLFNGVNPFGPRDPDAGIYTSTSASSPLTKVQILLENASLASQASGPPGSDFEMSCGGRNGAMMGRRLLTRKALYGQKVAVDDSVLATLRNATAPAYGLTKTYYELIQAAFWPKYWQATAAATRVDVGGALYYQREANFTLFFSLAVMMYESTLVSDDAPIDRLLAGDGTALTPQELQGMGIFLGKGKCINCHKGPELTAAGSPLQKEKQERGLVERMIMGDNGVALYDNGFYNIGVRPTVEDIGSGAMDPFGNPLSWTRQFQNFINTGDISHMKDKFEVDPCKFDVDPCVPAAPNFREAVDGAFKTPTLRNVELTGPYFHNGSRSTLAQVVEFYNRGGDRRNGGPCSTADSDTTGFKHNCSNLDADITNLELTADEQAALVAFMKRPLTDERVRCELAPFDHPQLKIAHGHYNSFNTTNKQKHDYMQNIPEVGQGGRCGPAGPGPILPFEDLLMPIDSA